MRASVASSGFASAAGRSRLPAWRASRSTLRFRDTGFFTDAVQFLPQFGPEIFLDFVHAEGLSFKKKRGGN